MMSRLKPPSPAKLIISAFMRDKGLIHPLADQLTARFGAMDIVSKWFAFDYTDYYEPEMGRGLVRRMMAFEKLIDQEELANIKHFAMDLEEKNSENGSRRVNIDPGYLLKERFVLSTGKNFAHRIYIGRNIYADLALVYRKGKFEPLPWTYPDYMSADMMSFLQRARNKYIYDTKEKRIRP